MSENKSIVFKRNFELNLKTDFKEETVEAICKIIQEISCNKKIDFEITDFHHLLTIENLTDSAIDQLSKNSYGINFNRINVDFIKHSDSKPIRMHYKICDSIKNVKIWFIITSDAYELIYKDDIKLKLKEINQDLEIDKLGRMRINY